MRSTIIAAVTLALATLVAVPAFAAPASTNGVTESAQTKRTDGDKEKKFPMPAAQFKAKVDQRLAKGRARMEERASKADPAAAKEMRAKFDAVAANVNAEVTKACADGTVTADEAKAVRAANPHHHHGKQARHTKKANGASK